MSQTRRLLLLNVLAGNGLLYFTISNNWFLASLLLDFSFTFHFVYTVLAVVSMLVLVRFMRLAERKISKIGLALLFTVCPVVLTCWLVIGYAFRESTEFTTRLLFSLEFGSLVGLIAGAPYWLPFWWINLRIIRQGANNDLQQRK